MKQRDVFLNGEGDQWYRRNKNAEVLQDPLLLFLRQCVGPGSLLEIGCSSGARLKELSSISGLSVSGIEPSAEAVQLARNEGLDVRQGTAEKLDFDSGSFDWVVFGFCLYLCDRVDLFRIAAEADRILKDGGRVIIYDFDPGVPCLNTYCHFEGVTSFKMDYAQMFLWNPAYALEGKRCFSHTGEPGLHSDRNERLSISMLRKQENNVYVACDAL
jgi:SAM-dependent methyltransferase